VPHGAAVTGQIIAKRSSRAVKSVATAQPITQMRQQHAAAEAQRKIESGWATALLAEAKEIVRNVPGVKQLEEESSATTAAAFEPQPTAAELELPSIAELGLHVVEPPGPRSTQMKFKADGAGDDDDGDSDSDSDENEYEYEQFLGELLASVPESAGAHDPSSSEEAAKYYSAAIEELTMYEQAVAKAMERSAARGCSEQ